MIQLEVSWIYTLMRMMGGQDWVEEEVTAWLLQEEKGFKKDIFLIVIGFEVGLFQATRASRWIQSICGPF